MSSKSPATVPKPIEVAGVVLARVEYRGEPVVTFAMVDRVHQRPEGTAKRTFNENRERFVTGEDFVEVSRDEIRTDLPAWAFSKFAPGGVLLTRRGYLKLVKPLTDDRAWAVQGEMVDRYFLVEQIAGGLPADVREMIRSSNGIDRQLSHKVAVMEKSVAKILDALPAMIEARVETALAADPRRAVLAYVSVRELLDDAKALPKGRRGLNRRIGNAMRRRGEGRRNGRLAFTTH